MKQRVLVLVKPDGVRRCIAGDVLNIFMNNGVKLIAMKLVKVDALLAKKHYALLKDKFFFKEIVSYLQGALHDKAPVVAMVYEGENVIARCRAITGATNPEEALPQTIRGKYGRITTKGVYENVVHVSSDQAQAAREIKLWFKSTEILKV